MTTLEQLLVFRPAVQRRFRGIDNARRPRIPDAQIATYRRALDRIVRTATEEALSLFTEPQEEIRTDVLSRGTSIRIGGLRLFFSELVNDASQDGVFSRIAAAINRASGREMRRVLGIDPGEVIGTDLLEVFRARNVALISTVLIDLHSAVEEELELAQRENIPVRELRTRLQRRFGLSRARADLIARDQTLKLNAQLNQQRQQAVGVTRYVWDSSQDSRVRPDHAALHGTQQLWAVPPVTDRRTNRTNHPGEDYQCRCVAIPVTTGLLD